MLDKLIVFCSFVIILNSAIKLCTAADLSKNATSVTRTRVRNTRVNAMTEADEDTWQPIIPTHSVSTTPTHASDLWHSTDLRNNLANSLKQKHQGYINPQTYHNSAYNHHYHQHQHHHNGNYSKRHIKTSSLSSVTSPLLSVLPSSSASSQKNIKLRSHVYSTTNNKNNIKNSRGKGKTQPNSHYQQQQQQLYPLNIIETVYPQIQIPNDIISQVEQRQQKHQAKVEMNLISSKLNVNHVEDVAKANHTKPSSASTSSAYWHYLQQPQLEAKHMISLTPKIDTSNVNTTSTNSNMKINAFRNENETGKKNEKNSNSTSLTKTLNSIVTNENLIDNEIINTKQHNQHYHHYENLLHSGGVKPVTSTSNAADENLIKATKIHSVDAAANTAGDDEKNFNGKLLLLRKTLNNAQDFYDNLKNIILSDKISDRSSSDNNDDDADDDDDYDIYSNEDKTNYDNDLPNSSLYQELTDSSTTVAAVIAAAMDSFNIKNILLPSASIDEVQGHGKQIVNDTMKYSSPEDSNQMQNVEFKTTAASNDTQATGRLWNLLSTKAQKTTTTTTAHSSSLSPSTSKALTAISSGRKVKKVKKKFKKFLLPLVLAYKLKFMALIPLLIGGLTLLVGTTGLAGFFFALFTAVMSLKSGSRNAIVVKKY
ncbi:rho GTPase-activating protein gacU [Lucilia sericata]|uniref:rho GTPase-activating protein gacU n=1 Tax=Lucilia sericata TaxID=13632 RepID=UPI0018A85705|nr:rho GTPase-activating protein gacU [Lucilia sericata]XP_037815182.1 rho GTPase-activating protein gacU [Lucilia sericata]XP_037815190.1 rho GTPase-activating protein gacU [Lucilia sericata]